jgi:hypothetical protein
MSPEELDCFDISRAEDSLLWGNGFDAFASCSSSAAAIGGFFHAGNAKAGGRVFLIGLHCAERLGKFFKHFDLILYSRRIRKNF